MSADGRQSSGTQESGMLPVGKDGEGGKMNQGDDKNLDGNKNFHDFYNGDYLSAWISEETVFLNFPQAVLLIPLEEFSEVAEDLGELVNAWKEMQHYENLPKFKVE